MTRLYPGGLFDFSIDDLPTAGESVNVVIPQFTAIPAGAAYRMQQAGGWITFSEDAGNSVGSAEGAEGYCPPPGDPAYTAGLTEGYWCVQLTIEDGGPNDADGVANRKVDNPGGVAVAAPVPDSDHGVGGALSPWWLVLMVLLRLLPGHDRRRP